MSASRGLTRWRRERPVVEPEVYDDRHLLDAARTGDREAIDALYRRHQAFAERAARRLCSPSDVDDVVSDAFVRVLTQLRRGGGPQVSFRAYLLTAVRSAHAEVVRRDARHVWTEEVEEVPASPVTHDAGSAERVESDALVTALRTLPLRWQLVLWWSGVERRPLADIGASLGLSSNAVAALAFRAREGLRTAYVATHLAPTDEACRPWREQLPRHLRGHLRGRELDRLLDHLARCAACLDALDELRRTLPALAR